jgi:hypothetical protein
VIVERAGLQVVAGFLAVVCHSVPCPSDSGGLYPAAPLMKAASRPIRAGFL